MSLKKALYTTVILTVALSLFAADDVLKWNKTPEAYFMTSEEKAAWKNVRTTGEAQQFIDEFRRKRGPQFQKDVQARIAAADKQFKLDRTPGSLTDRGRVFLIMGAPSRSTTNRSVAGAGSTALNSIEQQALIGTEWTYDADRIPVELGIKQLKVRFVADTRRGFENIDVNLGNPEPHLARAAEVFSNKYIQTQAEAAQRPAAAAPAAATPAASAPAATALDPLWSTTPALNGAVFTGDAFLSPREEPFYAYTLYVPKNADGFHNIANGTLVTLVRNEAGQQVVSERTPVQLSAYDSASGARFVDRSVALPPGKYEGHFAFYGPDGTTLLSSHRTSFEVAPKDVPRASALFLTSRIDTLEKQEPLDPFTFVATKYAVRADRQFRAGEKLGFFTIISNPTGSPQPQLMQKMTFKRDGKEFAKTSLEPAQVTQTGPNTFLVGLSFDPDTFPAGHYNLELQVRDMNAPDGSPLRTKGYVLTSEFDVVK
ncbi:MAG TPA: GWxTD domain-containing protein [Thermoanaerobaculia bacterium]